jgi:hypothetical protein
MVIYSPVISGSLIISGSIVTTNGGLPLTGSLVSSGSFTSIGPTIVSGSLTVITGSSIEFQVLDSGVRIGNLASDNHNITGSLRVSGSITGSGFLTTGTITAQTLVVQTITSSVDFVTGSTKTGTLASNTHQFTGSMFVTGGLFVTSGSVGVGTISPSYPLHVATSTVYQITAEQTSTNTSDANAYATFYVVNNAGSSQVKGLFGAGGNNVSNTALRNAVYYGAQSNHAVLFITNDINRMYISSSGNIGINTISPTEGTQSAGTLSIIPVSSVSGGPLIQFPGNGRIRPASSSDRLSIDGNALYLNNYISGNILMNVAGGVVGIGTASPNNLLSVRGNIDLGTTGYAFQGASQYGGITFPRGQLLWSNTNGQNQLYAMSNAYLNTNSWYYRNTAVSVGVAMDNGTGFLQAAGSGTADTTISYTNALTWDTNGVKMKGGSSYLNYYEEGSWTPALQNATVSYDFRSGTYVRIGNYVFVRWGFRIGSISGQSGTVTISGLPFTAVNWGAYQEPNISVSTGVLATADNAYRARLYKGGSDNSMYGRIANNGDTPWTTADLQNGSWIIGEMFYNV